MSSNTTIDTSDLNSSSASTTSAAESLTSTAESLMSTASTTNVSNVTSSKSSKCSCCTDCGDKTNTRYLYGKINGVSVFTGFLEKDDKLIWIGLDEKKHRVIDLTNENDLIFYKSQIQQYDGNNGK